VELKIGNRGADHGWIICCTLRFNLKRKYEKLI
jgi:hypothetical protein